MRANDREMRQQHGIDGGSTLWPKCDRCTRVLGTRFAVEAYEVADRGHTISGEPYTDIRAKCHGEEDVVRLEGCYWDMKRDGVTADAIRAAAVGAIVFFAPEEASRTIPARVFRAFMGAR